MKSSLSSERGYRLHSRILALTASLIALTGKSLTASADSYVTSSVTGLYPYTAAVSQYAIVFITPALPAGTEGCTHTPLNFLLIDMTDARASTIYATALTGFVSGITLAFGVRGCGNAGQAPLVYSVQLGSQS